MPKNHVRSHCFVPMFHIIVSLWCCILSVLPALAYTRNPPSDSTSTAFMSFLSPSYQQYFAIGGNLSVSDASRNRLGILYSMMYGYRLTPQSDIETSLNLTGSDGYSRQYMRLLSSTSFDIFYLFRPIPSADLRVGAGVSLRLRQLYWSAPKFQSPFDDEDRFARDIGLGAHLKVDYTIFQLSNLALGLQAMGQYYFLSIGGEYYFQNQPSTFQKLQLQTLQPFLIASGIFLRVEF